MTIIIDTNGEQRECNSITPDPSYPGFLRVEYQSRIRKGFTHVEWYETKDFIQKNPQLESLAMGGKQSIPEDIGVVSEANEKEIIDLSKEWNENCFVGSTLWISRGLGEGQTRKVIANTYNSVTVDSSFLVVPDKTSQYLISNNVHDPQVLGNTLPDSMIEKNFKVTVEEVN